MKWGDIDVVIGPHTTARYSTRVLGEECPQSAIPKNVRDRVFAMILNDLKQSHLVAANALRSSKIITDREHPKKGSKMYAVCEHKLPNGALAYRLFCLYWHDASKEPVVRKKYILKGFKHYPPNTKKTLIVQTMWVVEGLQAQTIQENLKGTLVGKLKVS
jgi:hypothetical protein